MAIEITPTCYIEIDETNPSKTPEHIIKIDGIELTSTFSFDNLRQAILSTGEDVTCDCCVLGEVYNGFDSGPLIFICPKGCSCHD